MFLLHSSNTNPLIFFLLWLVYDLSCPKHKRSLIYMSSTFCSSLFLNFSGSRKMQYQPKTHIFLLSKVGLSKSPKIRQIKILLPPNFRMFNVQIRSVDNIKEKMVKILCLALLIVLACQLQLVAHEQAQPFTGNKFIITQNSLNDKAITGTRISFSNSFVLVFKSSCGGSNASFTTRMGNLITVSTSWSTVPVPAAACVTIDGNIKMLLNKAVKYQTIGKMVVLLDSKSKPLLTLIQ